MSLFAAGRAPRHIVFGSGQRRTLGDYAADLGSRALVVTDERLGADPLFIGMLDGLRAAGVAVEIFDRAPPEVPLSAIADCAAKGAAFGPDVVIGIGGGSCIDLAKAVAVVLAHPGDIRSRFGEYNVPGPVLPIIAVPTTAGTGSEVTPVAVVSDSERTLKVGIASPFIIPTIALCDPELTLTAPSMLTAVSGADALTHAIEAYTAITRDPAEPLTRQGVFVGKNALSDTYALEAIRLLSGSLRIAVNHGEILATREAVMLGSMLAGLAFGTAGTAAAHAIQYPVGALTGTAHGLGVACLMPYVMEFNRSACEAEFGDIARAMGIDPEPDAEATDMAIDAVADLFADIGIPANLKALGLGADQLDWTAEQSLGAARLVRNNPRLLDLGGARAIVDAAFHGDRSRLRQNV